MRCVREDENVADDAVRLDAVCERLRELETDDGWRGKLLAEVGRAPPALRLDSENFSYGSTPFSSWIELFVRCPELKIRAQTLATDGLAYVVFGSSAGWLVFYGAFARRVEWRLKFCARSTTPRRARARNRPRMEGLGEHRIQPRGHALRIAGKRRFDRSHVALLGRRRYRQRRETRRSSCPARS